MYIEHCSVVVDFWYDHDVSVSFTSNFNMKTTVRQSTGLPAKLLAAIQRLNWISSNLPLQKFWWDHWKASGAMPQLGRVGWAGW